MKLLRPHSLLLTVFLVIALYMPAGMFPVSDAVAAHAAVITAGYGSGDLLGATQSAADWDDEDLFHFDEDDHPASSIFSGVILSYIPLTQSFRLPDRPGYLPGIVIPVWVPPRTLS
jgi:hypothetical protein